VDTNIVTLFLPRRRRSAASANEQVRMWRTAYSMSCCVCATPRVRPARNSTRVWTQPQMNELGSAGNSSQNLHLAAWLRYFEDIGLVTSIAIELWSLVRRESNHCDAQALPGPLCRRPLLPRLPIEAGNACFSRTWQPAAPALAGASRGVVIPVASLPYLKRRIASRRLARTHPRGHRRLHALPAVRAAQQNRFRRW